MAPKKQNKGDDKKGYNQPSSSDGRPGSSTEPIFRPVIEDLTEEQLEALSVAFSGLSLEEQRIVAENFEKAQTSINAQKKMLGLTVKQFDVKISNAEKKKTPQPRETHERYKRNLLTLTINCKDIIKSITVNKSGKVGSIRKEVCKVLGLRKDLKISMSNATIGNITNINTFVYSLGLNDNHVIHVGPITGNEETKGTTTNHDEGEQSEQGVNDTEDDDVNTNGEDDVSEHDEQ